MHPLFWFLYDIVLKLCRAHAAVFNLFQNDLVGKQWLSISKDFYRLFNIYLNNKIDKISTAPAVQNNLIDNMYLK